MLCMCVCTLGRASITLAGHVRVCMCVCLCVCVCVCVTQVLAPYDSEDARGLLKAAIRDEDPVVFLENELLYGTAFPVTPEVRVWGHTRTHTHTHIWTRSADSTNMRGPRAWRDMHLR